MVYNWLWTVQGKGDHLQLKCNSRVKGIWMGQWMGKYMLDKIRIFGRFVQLYMIQPTSVLILLLRGYTGSREQLLPVRTTLDIRENIII